jgi:hypothetical protein
VTIIIVTEWVGRDLRFHWAGSRDCSLGSGSWGGNGDNFFVLINGAESFSARPLNDSVRVNISSGWFGLCLGLLLWPFIEAVLLLGRHAHIFVWACKCCEANVLGTDSSCCLRDVVFGQFSSRSHWTWGSRSILGCDQDSILNSNHISRSSGSTSASKQPSESGYILRKVRHGWLIVIINLPLRLSFLFNLGNVSFKKIFIHLLSKNSGMH